MFKNFRFSKALALVCLSGLIMSCERKMDESTKLKIQLPHTAANQMYSKAGISAQTVGGGASWGVADPSVFDDISCFAIAVEAPDLNQFKCKRSDGTIAFRPGVLVGAFPAGEQIIIEVPAGPGRRIHAIGFAATSLSACTNFDINNGPDKANLSAPHMLGSVKKDLEPGDNTVVINASLSVAGKFHDCDKPNFGDPPDNSGDPFLTVADNIMVNEGSSYDLSFYLPGPAQNDVTFDVMFSGNTATYPTDILSALGNPLSLTIAAGTQNVMIQLVAPDDATVEGNETFNYQISNVAGAFVPVTTFSGTVIDNDTGGGVPNLFVAPNGATEGGAPSLTVWLDSPPSSDVTFNFSTSDGTAVAPTDYSALSGGVTIPSGNTITSIGFSTVQDTVYEGPDEIFYVSLSSVAGATVVSDFGAITITEDDSVPTIYVADDAAVEGNVLSFVVTLSNAGVSPVGFNWATLDGTATLAGDYSSASNSIVMPPGVLASTIMVSTVDDAIAESSEFMYVTLSGPVSAVIGDGMAQGTINDNDGGTPNLTVMDYTVLEGSPLDFNFYLDASYGSDITISFNVSSGTAFASGTDFSGPPGGYAVTMLAGNTVVTHQITTIQDSSDEYAETMSVSITSAPFTNIVDAVAVGTISDDDAAPFLFVDDFTVDEAGELIFVASISSYSGKDVSFVWTTYDQTAVGAGADYFGGSNIVSLAPGDWLTAITIALNDDALTEPSETMMISLSSVADAVVADDVGVGTITDNDLPTLSISDASGTEGQTLHFLVTMSQAIGSDVTFEYYTSNNTASSPADFAGVSVPLLATIPSGFAFYQIDIPTVDDGVGESTEIFDVFLQSLSGATASDIVGLGTILDNDAGASLFVLDTSVSEGLTASVMFSLSAVSGSNVDIGFTTYDSSAFGAGTDYFGGSFSVQIPAGQTFATFDIGTVQDVLSEGPEFFMVSITSASNATIAVPGADDSAVVTIIDDDGGPTLWMNAPAIVSEGTTAVVDMVMDSASGVDVTFRFYSFDGTAISGSGDYVTVPFSPPWTISAGQTILSVPIAINADSLDEHMEHFNVSLDFLANASLSGPATMAISIADMDPEPSIHISDATHLEGSSLNFHVTMSQMSGRDVYFNISTFDMTATSVSLSDYTGYNTGVTIPAGNTIHSFLVITTNDTLYEPMEDFGVTLTSLVNLNFSLSGVGAKGIIRDNDGWGVNPKVKAANADASDFFGGSVNVHGNLFVVGAGGEDSNQTTVSQGNVSSGDNSQMNVGAAYVFLHTGGSHQQRAYLKPSNGESLDQFGHSVAIDGNLVAVGAIGESSNQTFISNGPTASGDNSLTNAGAVYLFRDTGGTWIQEAYLKPSNMDANDYFGYSVAVSGNHVAVGAKGEASSATAITNGSTASVDNSNSGSGAVYVFYNNGGTWEQTAYVKASNSNPSDYFGSALDLFGSLMVVGAWSEASNTQTVINSGVGSSDNSAATAGAAYVYRQVGGTWVEEAYLKGANTESNDNFGKSVAVFGDFVAVGAPRESSAQNFVSNGPTASGNNTLAYSGAAYIFEHTSGSWYQSAYLKAVNPSVNDEFGSSVSATRDVVVVGAPGEDSGFGVIDYGPYAPGDDSLTDSGAVYVFQRQGASWEQVNYIKPAVPQSSEYFGKALSIDGDLLVVGAEQESSVATSSGAVDYYNWRGPMQAAVTRAPIQAETAGSHPIYFNVRFSRPINPGTFVVGDIVNSGTATGVTWTISNTGDNMNFTITATAGTGAGSTYLPSVPVDAVTDPSGMGNAASFPLGPATVTLP